MTMSRQKLIIKDKKEVNLEIIFKGLYNKSNGLNRYLQKKIDSRDKYTLEIFWENKCLDNMWEYVIRFSIRFKYNGLTTIGDYTNKKGVVSQAHFNNNGSYMGSVRKLGLVPIKCEMWEIPNRESWTINRKGDFCRI